MQPIHVMVQEDGFFNKRILRYVEEIPSFHWIFFKDADNMKKRKKGIMTKDEYQKMEKQ
ncbi:MAG: hypothetical protein ACLTOV_14060 [Phocaeicola sp.]